MPSRPAPSARTPRRRAGPGAVLIGLGLLLGGCQWLGIESPEQQHQAKAADGQAIGSACRHAGRALEDCFVLNPKAQRAAVFAGWREMDEYMRENKIEALAPTVPRPGSRQAETAQAGHGSDGAPAAGKAGPDEVLEEGRAKPARHAS